MPELQYQNIDTIPEIAEERSRVREHAWGLVNEREQLIQSGQSHEVPVVLDALSTANSVLNAERNFGKESEEYSDRLAGLRQDCSRLVAEWFRKKRPEYFPPTQHYFDSETGDFYSHGLSIRQMTENALRPIADSPEEVARRVNERVEDETPRIIRKVGSFALSGAGIRTISECTDKAIKDYEQDQVLGNRHRGYDGYVPEIKKVMIRDMRLDDSTGDRFQEQIGLPGEYIDHYVIQKALKVRGVDAQIMDKTELHGTQLLVQDDLMDFVRLLDDVAGEEWCTNVFMGEEVPDDYQKDYENFRQEALDRQEGLSDITESVVTFVLDLAEDEFDKTKAPAHVENFVKKLLIEMAQQDLSVAEQMFDKETVSGLKEVKYLQSLGMHQEAYERLQEVEQAAPGGGFCSGGSCGLESVNMTTGKDAYLKSKLKVASGETVVRDKERSCKCGAKSIVYAYSKDKVKKYCESCDAYEEKVSKK